MHARKAAVCRVAILSLLFQCFQALGQLASLNASRQSPGVDLKTHKFRPVISPDRATVDTSGTITEGEALIRHSAARQIDALLQDKQTRTAAQKKISSKLLYTVRMLAGLPAAPGVPSLETGVDVDDEGNVFVDITAHVSGHFLTQLKEQGAFVYGSYPSYNSVRAMVPAASLEIIANWPDVVFIRPRQEAMTAGYSPAAPRLAASSPALVADRSERVWTDLQAIQRPVKLTAIAAAPTGQGSKTSEGDLTHRAFDARVAFGVNGAGIKIGVLSDGASNLAASQALGDLPPDVTILPG